MSKFLIKLEEVTIIRAEDVKKHGTHDQKKHGSWADGGGSTDTGLDAMPYEWKPEFTLDAEKEMSSLLYTDVLDMFKNVAKDPIAIRLYGGELDAIVKEGRFKSLNEIEGGEGLVSASDEYREGRVKLENGKWRIPKDGVQPIYGFIDTQYDSHNADSTVIYGDVKITLKDAVSGRATFTAGDSLNSWLTPVLITEARKGNINKTAVTEASKEGTGFIWAGGVGYFEAQIHGGVSLKDIKSIEVNKYGRVESTTYDALKALGIKVKVERWSK